MPSKSFTFHEEWKETLSCLPPQVRLEVYDAVIEYGLSGTLVELKAMAGMAFNIIKNGIDNDIHRAESIRKKRSEAGKKHKGNQHTLKLEQMEQVFQSNWNKCSKQPLNRGVSKDLKIGTSVPTSKNQVVKEGTLFPPNEESTPITPKEDIPPIIPQENLSTKSGAKRFVKPTIDEIKAYCQEKEYNIDAEQFWYFYESKGWKVGNTPMKSWKSACVTWIKRKKYETTQTTQRTYQVSGNPTTEEMVGGVAELIRHREEKRRNGG